MHDRMIKSGFSQALAIGQRNQEIETLVRNWCSHAQVEPWAGGGVGMVEAMTGLPVGMRVVRCPHAKHPSAASMNVEALALSFYERNCIGCAQRLPGRLPNISLLYGELQQQKQEEEKQRENARRDGEDRIRRRKEARALLRNAQDAMREEIINLLDKIDADGDSEAVDRLVLLSKQVPGRFDSQIQAELREFAKVGGHFRTSASLKTLAILAPEDPSLVPDALKAMAQGDAIEVAGDIIERALAPANSALVAAAIPALCQLTSRPHRPIGFSEMTLRPGPLIKAYGECPDAVIDGLEQLFRSPHKEVRISAAQAVERLIAKDSDLGPRMAQVMLNSLSLPDDHYEDGTSSGYVANAMATAMLRKPTEIDSILQQAISKAPDDLADAIFETYKAVPRIVERQQIECPEALRLAVKRAIEVLLSQKNKLLSDAVQVLDYTAKYFPAALEGNEDTLLGAAALLDSEGDKPVASKLVDPGWNQMKALEAFGRAQTLNRAIDSAGGAIHVLAFRNPGAMLDSLTQTFQGVRDKDEGRRLRAVVVRGVGGIAENPEWLNKALPLLYTAMTDPAVVVRATAAEEFGELLGQYGHALPILLHETFLLLLGDPYVTVHIAALNAIRRKEMPSQLAGRVYITVAGLCLTYSNAGDNDRVLKDCLEELATRAHAVGMTEKILDFIMKCVAKMDAKEAVDFLPWLDLPGIKEHPGLVNCISRALKDPDVFEYHGDGLMRLLQALPTTAARGIRDQLADAVVLAYKTHQGLFSLEIADFLNTIGELPSAARAFAETQATLPDTEEKEAAKRHVRLLEIATQIEAAVQAGDTPHALNLSETWAGELKKSKEQDEVG